MSLFSPNEDQHLTITAPDASKIPSGPYTVAVLFRNLPFNRCNLWRAFQPDNFTQLNAYFDGDVWINFSQWDGNLDISEAKWRWLVTSKSSEIEAPRIHLAEYVSTGTLNWIHDDTNDAVGGFSDLNRFSIGDELATGFQGDIACLAAFTSEFTDTEIESLFVRSSANIMNAGPKFFVHWPEAAGIEIPFVDIAGSGVETIRTGTWFISSDPNGYNFSLGRSGKPKVWDGSSWVQHQAKIWNGSTWLAHPMSGYDGSDFIITK